jgi:hypothetical protein
MGIPASTALAIDLCKSAGTSPPTALAIIPAEPLVISGSSKKAREERARSLAGSFVKFINDHLDLLVQVRKDFLSKDAHETIMGCKTWTEYCVGVLYYSESRIRSLIAGKIPELAKFNGTANRKPIALVPAPIPPKDLAGLEENNPTLATKIRDGAVTVRDTRPYEHEPKLGGDYFRHLGHLLDGIFKGQINEKLDVLCRLPISKVTPKIKQDAKAMIDILQDVSVSAEKYIAKLKKLSKARVV